MAEPIPAQKAPYGVNIEAGKDYWWCACGRSASQPFCDGSHKSVGLPRKNSAPPKQSKSGCAAQIERQQALLRPVAQEHLMLNHPAMLLFDLGSVLGVSEVFPSITCLDTIPL